MNDKTRFRTFGVLFGSGCLFLFGLVVFLFAAGIGLAIFLLTHGYLAAKLIAMVIVLVFAATGVGLMVLAWKIPWRERGRRQRHASHPEEPWLWREDWEQGFAQAEGRSHARFLMTSRPGVLGGKLRGYVKSGGAAAAGIEVNLTLSCISPPPGYATQRKVHLNPGSSRAARLHITPQFAAQYSGPGGHQEPRMAPSLCLGESLLPIFTPQPGLLRMAGMALPPATLSPRNFPGQYHEANSRCSEDQHDNHRD